MAKVQGPIVFEVPAACWALDPWSLFLEPCSLILGHSQREHEDHLMRHPTYPHLFTPIRIGNFEVANRICHVPTDISSANADGSVNQRVITYHEQVAKGGCGLIIVGASTPDKKTGRPTATCLAVGEGPL